MCAYSIQDKRGDSLGTLVTGDTIFFFSELETYLQL